ncbi:MAG: hypothetical protein IT381_24450 [Deltaproteobacteria bacterium]|nr:hypothetical protein [Deltaproteobacteria bacterium]
MNALLVATSLLTSGLGTAGDSCAAASDCDPGLSCTNGTCTEAAGAPCQRTADCPSEMRCRANQCVAPGQAPPALPPPPPPPPTSPFQPQYGAPAPDPNAGFGANVTLSTRNGEPVVVSLQAGEGGAALASCVTPCAMRVQPGQYYLAISGDGVRSGGGYVVIQGDGVIMIRRSTNAMFGWGISATAIGGSALVAGATLIGIGATIPFGSFFRFNGDLIIAGTIVLMVGVAFTIAGPIALGRSVKSKIAFTSGGIAMALASFDIVPLKEGGALGTVGFTF